MTRAWVVGMVLVLAGCGSDKGSVEELVICEAGALQCSGDGLGVERCADTGESWEPLEQCIQGASCNQGRCQCPEWGVAGSEACFVPGVEGCADWFTAVDGSCESAAGSCGAGQIYAGGECRGVGVAKCPDGWVQDPEGTGCLPDEKPCDQGKLWVAGEGCLNPGPVLSCGNVNSPWPGHVPEGELVYVHSESAVAAEEGTSTAPYKSLQDAIDNAPDDATVVLGTGFYDGGALIDRPLSILGKCAEYVTVTGSVTHTPAGHDFSSQFAIVVSDAAGGELSGFTLLGADWVDNSASAGIFVGSSADFTVSDIHFKFPSGAAVHGADSPSLTIANCHFEGVNVLSGQVGAYGQTAYGVLLQDSGGSLVTDSHFDSTQGADIKTVGSVSTVTRNHFDRRGVYGGLSPVGVWIYQSPAQTVISGNRFYKKMTHAVIVEESVCLLERNLVEGSVTDFDDLNGPAIKGVDSQIDIVANHILDNQFAGINLRSCSGAIEYNRVEGGKGSDPGLKGGDGIVLVDCDPGPIKITGNSVVGNVRNGLLLSGSIVQVKNNVVAATEKSPSLNASIGAGLSLVEGSDGLLEGNIFVDNFMNGIRITDSFGRVQGNVIAGTTSAEGGVCGGGLVAINATMAQGISGNLFADNDCTAVLLQDSNVSEISGNSIEKTVGANGTLGIGIVSRGSSVNVLDNWIRNNEDAGVLLDDTYSVLEGNVFEDNGVAGVGGGLVVQNVDTPPVTIKSNTFAGNGFAGVVIRTSTFELRRNAMLNNVPNAAGVGGAGAWLETDSNGEVKLNVVRGNRLAGLAAFAAAELSVNLNLVQGTKTGALPGDGVPVQMADGIVALAGSFVSALYNRCQSNALAGLLFMNAEGYASGNQLVDNGTFGLHLISSNITIEENQIEGNGSGGQSTETGREVPDYLFGQLVPCAFELGEGP